MFKGYLWKEGRLRIRRRTKNSHRENIFSCKWCLSLISFLCFSAGFLSEQCFREEHENHVLMEERTRGRENAWQRVSISRIRKKMRGDYATQLKGMLFHWKEGRHQEVQVMMGGQEEKSIFLMSILTARQERRHHSRKKQLLKKQFIRQPHL